MTRRSLILTVLIALVPALVGLVVVRAATTPAASAATIPAAVVNLDTPRPTGARCPRAASWWAASPTPAPP